MELPSHGRVLVLGLPAGTSTLGAHAIYTRLKEFVGQPAPFVGVLIDLGETDYHFSVLDIRSIGATMAKGQRGQVVPCAIVMRGAPALELQSLLEITRLNEMQGLRVVETREAGWAHIIEELARRGA